MIDLRLGLLALPFALLSPFAPAQDFPVTIAHAYGETVIESQPERVVTWGWVAQDIALDLGIVPVGMGRISYGSDVEGVLPWTRQAIDSLVAETDAQFPAILSEGSLDVPLEAILALDPDLVLAPGSGITEDEYRALSGFVPVIPFKSAPWQGTWQDSVATAARALGRVDQGDALIAETEAMIASAVERHPAIAGKSFINFAVRNDGTVSVRGDNDPRTQLLVDAGMVSAAGLPDSPDDFAYRLSHELVGQVDADVLIAFSGSRDEAEAFLSLPYIASSPHGENGRIVSIEEASLSMAVGGTITPLSLRWALDDYIEAIAASLR